MKDVRVRYAPSPTGYLHIGNARTALFNYLFTKNLDGKMIIRIEDTDTERNIEGGEKSQLDNLKWLGVTWDESIDLGGEFTPYNQLARHEMGIYKPFIDQLLESKMAYKCYCSTEELDLEAEKQKENGEIPRYSGKCRNLTAEQIKAYEDEGRDYTIRFKVPENTEYKWNDIVKGDVVFNSKDVSGDFNIVKRNGIPTYNFVVVLDDHLMKISHVLRGEDHISNTPKQLMIYEALGFDVPIFAHMTLIVNETGKKLSKRDTSIIQFIEDYRKLGYLPEAMFNFIALLGWSPVGEEEIFTQDELIKMFDASRLSKSAAKFDVNKLSWINNQYIKAMADEKYLEFVMPFVNEIENAKMYSQEDLNKIALLYKDQISFGAEIKEVSDLFFKSDRKMDEQMQEFVKQDGVKETLEYFKNAFIQADSITEADVKALIKETQKATGAKGKMLFMPIRIATTMQMHGPELPVSLTILSKETVVNNIETVIASI